MTIQSDRFILRTLNQGDVSDRYLKWLCSQDNPQIRYTRKKHDIKEVKSYVSQRENDDTVLFLGIFVRDSGNHIGNIKYEPIVIEEHQATMGILIGEKSWRGVGVATEVINATVIWLQKNLGIREFFLGVDLDNIYAIKAYEKSGFTKTDMPHDSENIIIMQLGLNILEKRQ
ncbi:hypothetical protein SP60_02195 [Candidatus Thioglobus autotrophicus]|uniref:N-acetyltransferase domain-containing protein n=1 Tax=Candidatus Thioglobus autotrophicus TaxID=1705394 RepID=A0A0M3TUM7_9GAMM|nr:hypothetical protein SP60_02195 [Candidatus Thioglobus autotrophicus]